MNSRDWKAKGCEGQCLRRGYRVSARAHLVSLTLQSWGRDIRQTQSPLSSALGVGENERVAGKNTFDRSRERLRHGADCTADDARKKGF